VSNAFFSHPPTRDGGENNKNRPHNTRPLTRTHTQAGEWRFACVLVSIFLCTYGLM